MLSFTISYLFASRERPAIILNEKQLFRVPIVETRLTC